MGAMRRPRRQWEARPTGASIEAVQRMLGHARAAMTLDVYGGLHDDDLEQLADRFEGLTESYRGTEGVHASMGEVIELP